MNAETIIEESKTIQEQVEPHLREAATFFHENEGELFTLEEATGLIASELEIDNTIAARTISQLVGDTVDPVIQVQKDTDKYVGVVEFHEFDGAYGYINYDDQFGKGKRVVCQQCVNEATLDAEVTHATENDPVGSFSGGATWDELLTGIHEHYEQAHDSVPEDIATGATLASGTTIGGNTAFHAGNESNVDHNNLSNRTHAGDDLTPSSVSSDTLEATGSITDPEGNTVTSLEKTDPDGDKFTTLTFGIAEVRHELGLTGLNFTNGWYDLFNDESKIQSKDNIQGFNGYVTTSGGVFGTFTSKTQTLSSIPSSVRVRYDADAANTTTVEDGDQFNYNVDTDGSIANENLKFTGVINERERSSGDNNWSGSQRSFTVQGNQPVDATLTLIGKEVNIEKTNIDGFSVTESGVRNTNTQEKTVFVAPESGNYDLYISASSYLTNTSDDYSRVWYSTDGGNSYTQIVNRTGNAKETEYHSFNGNINLDQGDELVVKIEVKVDATSGSNTTEINTIDIENGPVVETGEMSGTFAGESFTTSSLSGGQEFTKTVNGLSQGAQNYELTSIEGEEVDVTVDWTESTTTVDPSITIDSDSGTQTISYTGTLNEGESVDLSNEVDTSKIGGSVTVTANSTPNINSPAGNVKIVYEHSGIHSGGLIEYTFKDKDNNSVKVSEDGLIDLSFTNKDVNVTITMKNGFKKPVLNNYLVYFK